MFFKHAIHFCSYHLQESTFRTLETTRGKALAASSQGDTQSKRYNKVFGKVAKPVTFSIFIVDYSNISPKNKLNKI